MYEIASAFMGLVCYRTVF